MNMIMESLIFQDDNQHCMAVYGDVIKQTQKHIVNDEIISQ